MPEGPELYASACFVNNICKDRIFSGKIIKSEISTKNPDVDWDSEAYAISATSRGKELRLTVTNAVKTEGKNKSEAGDSVEILLRFGMSGKFMFTPIGKMEKHAHLNFFTATGDMVLSFVDYRRFGRWEVHGNWGRNRGPCVITEYSLFRKNILANIHKALFGKPICEVLLDQAYFNGIGNYLRAEILFRLRIPPFVSARSVLEPLLDDEESKVTDEVKAKSQVKVGSDQQDILQMCTLLPNEVVYLDGDDTKYFYDKSDVDSSKFVNWLRCYTRAGMNNLVDHKGRTVWFSGPAGPLTPSGNKTRGKISRKKKTSGVKEANSVESNKKAEKLTRTSVKELAKDDKQKKTRSTRPTQNELKTPKKPKRATSSRKRTHSVSVVNSNRAEPTQKRTKKAVASKVVSNGGTMATRRSQRAQNLHPE